MVKDRNLTACVFINLWITVITDVIKTTFFRFLINLVAHIRTVLASIDLSPSQVCSTWRILLPRQLLSHSTSTCNHFHNYLPVRLCHFHLLRFWNYSIIKTYLYARQISMLNRTYFLCEKSPPQSLMCRILERLAKYLIIQLHMWIKMRRY